MEPIYKYCNKYTFTGSRFLLLRLHSPRIQQYATAHSDPSVSSAFTFQVQYVLRCTESWRQMFGFNYPIMQHHIPDSESSAKTTVKISKLTLLLFTDTATYLNWKLSFQCFNLTFCLLVYNSTVTLPTVFIHPKCMVILLLTTCNNPSDCVLNTKLPLYAITSVLYEHVPTSYYSISLLLYNIK